MMSNDVTTATTASVADDDSIEAIKASIGRMSTALVAMGDTYRALGREIVMVQARLEKMRRAKAKK